MVCSNVVDTLFFLRKDKYNVKPQDAAHMVTELLECLYISRIVREAFCKRNKFQIHNPQDVSTDCSDKRGLTINALNKVSMEFLEQSYMIPQ